MRLPLLFLAMLLLALPAAAERTVTDSAGRAIAVPDRIERVFAAGPPASILLYVLAPDRMIGWPRAPRPEEMPYIAPEYRDLPEVGWLTGRGDTVNLEVLLQSEPDLILDFGSVRETYVSLAERVQQQTGIPYILIDGTFENTAAAVRLLGEVLGVEERAERLATYVENSFAEIETILTCRWSAAGFAITEVPSHEKLRVHGTSNLNAVSDGIRVLTSIMHERRRAREVAARARLAPVAARVAPEPVAVLDEGAA